MRCALFRRVATASAAPLLVRTSSFPFLPRQVAKSKNEKYGSAASAVTLSSAFTTATAKRFYSSKDKKGSGGDDDKDKEKNKKKDDESTGEEKNQQSDDNVLNATEEPIIDPTSFDFPTTLPAHELTPTELTGELDKHIVGQRSAKKAVAVALRNRWRRRQLKDDDLRGNITPKNILMIGPTGVGKTEISRRIAKLIEAPFVKVEATKYTEVGFRGKDVESIIEDLYANAKTKAQKRLENHRQEEAKKMAHDVIWTALQRGEFPDLSFEDYKAKFDAKELDEVSVTIDVTVAQEKPKTPEQAAVAQLFGSGEAHRQKTRITKPVPEAFELSMKEAFMKLVDPSQVASMAKVLAQDEGIVFVDEIDKVVCESNSPNADVSSLGVQQDLLPLIEGSTVTTKDGTTIETDNILFVCSGAFHSVKPSDMIAELQGRLPVRVELTALSEEEFRLILTEPKANLLLQQKELLKTEKIDLQFTDEGVNELARITAKVNSTAQNIGARRLHTVIERVMDEYSFNCDKYMDQTVTISAENVQKATSELVDNLDLAKYLL